MNVCAMEEARISVIFSRTGAGIAALASGVRMARGSVGSSPEAPGCTIPNTVMPRVIPSERKNDPVELAEPR